MYQMKKLFSTRYRHMNNPQLGKLVGPQLQIFFLYKFNNPFGPIIILC